MVASYASAGVTARRDGDQSMPMCGYVQLILSVQPGEQPKSGGIGSHGIRRAQFHFSMTGVQIGHCTMSRGAVAGGNREWALSNEKHPSFGSRFWWGL